MNIFLNRRKVVEASVGLKRRTFGVKVFRINVRTTNLLQGECEISALFFLANQTLKVLSLNKDLMERGEDY